MGDSALYKEMGKRIRDRRRELHMTQEQLAEKMNVTPQMISTAENGTKGIRPENIVKLSSALDLSCDYLLTGNADTRNLSAFIEKTGKLSKTDLERFTEIFYLIKSLTGETPPK